MGVAVGSVFHGAWRFHGLQQWFLSRTTPSYSYMMACQKKPPVISPWVKKDKPSHSSGIQALIPWFESSPHEWCLLLDSDAFPVKQGWEDIVKQNIAKHKKEYSAPVRTENLDVFPHVCFLFMPRSSVRELLETVVRGGGSKTLLGNIHYDIGTELPIDRCFPLIRSNIGAVSPLYHSVYFDVAYHKAAASRGSGMGAEGAYWPSDKSRDLWPDANLINRLVGEERFTC